MKNTIDPVISILLSQLWDKISVRYDSYCSVVWNMNGLFSIWDVIRTKLTKSIIFQDGYCTTKQIIIPSSNIYIYPI